MAIADLRIVGRATQGVRLIKINEGDAIAAVAKVEVEEGAEDDETALAEGDQAMDGAPDSPDDSGSGSESGSRETEHPAENEEN